MQVAKWGNSLAIRLPARIVQELNLKSGDKIDVVAKASESAGQAGAVAFEIRRKQTRAEIAQSLSEFAWRLPKDYKFDREEANRRGNKS
jgi:antitoxin MazE